jgi:Zinc finger protein
LWTREKTDINLLVDSFFQNDPYPRPRATDLLYQPFCKGYTSAYSEDGQELAFFEQEQAQRDLGQ